MSSKSKKSMKTVTGKTVPQKPLELGAIRTNFDGLKDVASKLPDDDKVKKSLMDGIENAYLATVDWARGHIGQNLGSATA